MTPMQRKMLAAIEELTVDGVCPTYRDLQARLGMASLNNVHRLIHILLEEGHLTRTEGRARSLRVVGAIDRRALDRMSHADLIALRSEIDRRIGA